MSNPEIQDDDKKPSTSEDLAREARETYDDYVKGWAEIRKRADQCMRCLGEFGPWPESERTARNVEGAERPCLHEDVLTQYVNKVINQAQSAPIGIEVHPNGDGADEHTALMLEDRIRHIDEESNAVHAREAALESAIQQGLGVWEVGTAWATDDSGDTSDTADMAALFKQKITTIAAPDTWNYVIDPDCVKPDWSDMKGAFKLTRFSHAEFLREFPDAEFRDFTGLISTAGSWIDDKSIQVAEWWRREPGEPRKALLIQNPDGTETAVWADKLADHEIKGSKVIDEREVKTWKVMKRLTNGVEILKKKTNAAGEIEFGMEWPDYEIPVLVTTGRVKYEDGKRIIDSLIYKAIIGQLLYDFCISAIQEEINRAIKVKFVGPEGSFNTSTNWDRLHRDASNWAEYKIVYDQNGQRVERPEVVDSGPVISALLEARQHILIGIQNAIGMSSTERMDRTAKSGKALDALEEGTQIATSHFTNYWKMQIAREGRIKQRLLAKIEAKGGKSALRDRKGNHQIADVPKEVFAAPHMVSISAGKAYQTMEDKAQSVFDGLVKSSNEIVVLATLPESIRMLGLGERGETLALELEAMQPPQMQQARAQAQEAKKDPASAMNNARVSQQQAEQFKQLAQQYQQEMQKLQQEALAKTAELNSKELISKEDNKTKIICAWLATSSKEDVSQLEASYEQITADLERTHARLLQADQQAHDAALTAAEHAHAANMGAQQQDHEAGLQGEQLAAQQAQAEQAAQQPEPTA